LCGLSFIRAVQDLARRNGCDGLRHQYG
jgi:hypothetical protein